MDQDKEVILSLPKKETRVTRQEDEMKWNKCLDCLDIKSALWEHYKHIWW